MKSIMRGALLLSSAVPALVAMPAFAQDAAETSAASNGNDIIVTARRTEERLQDVPISITVFSQEQLSNNNIVTAGDLATYTPSLSSNTRFGLENTSFAIRGFTQEKDTSPSVGVYFAEVTAPRAAGNTTSGNGAGPGQLFDLQNVQILKGPQGTLFGRNTTGGAVLLTPRKPTDRLEGYVEGSIGNYDMRRIQAVINVPLADTFRVRFGVDRMVRDGYLHNISGIGPSDFADVNYWAFRASILAELTPTLENYTIFTYTKSDTNGSLPKPYATNFSGSTTGIARAFINSQLARTGGNYYDVLNGFDNPFSRLRQWQAINTTTWQASDTLTIKNIASYGEYRQQQSFSVYGEYGANDAVNGFSTIAPGYRFYYGATANSPASRYATAQSTFVEELQFQGHTSNDRLTYQFGGYAEISNPLGWQRTLGPNNLACRGALDSLDCYDPARLAAPNGNGRAAGNLQDYQNRYSFRDYALFAQATYKVTDKLSLTGGFRYTWSSVSAQSMLLRGSSPSGTPGTPLVWNCAFSPAVNSTNADGTPAATNPAGVVQGGTSAQVRADPSRCLFNHHQSASKPTWLIDVDYKPAEDILLYAKWARGFRQGGLSANSFFGDVWQPEKLDTYEVGLKASFHGSVNGYFNVSAFYNNFTNQQLQALVVGCPGNAQIPTPPPTAAQCPTGLTPSASAGIVNAGKSTIKGLEVDASISPLRGLRFDVGYAFLDTKVSFTPIPGFPQTANIPAPIGFTGINPRIVNGGELALAPRHKITVTASYKLPVSEDIGNITISGTYSYAAEQFITQFAPAGFSYLDEQNNVNLNLNWNNIVGKPVDLTLFVTNLTKEKYHTSRLGGSFGFDSAILNEPRMFGARVRVRFGN
jgi:iron complex outermembrane receptor protein